MPVSAAEAGGSAPGGGGGEPALREVFKGVFRIGAALNPGHVAETTSPGVEQALVLRHFDSLTPENALKWGPVHPRPGEYAFGQADRFVEFGVAHGMDVIGHTLVWHSQTPRWVFEGADGALPSREVLLERMRDHIHTVVGRYKGRIRGWDVVNEALNDDGSLRASPWLKGIGEDYLVKAFEYAHEADPQAELYYNDYSLEGRRKREGAVRLLRKLQESGARVTGVGMQGHYGLEWPSVQEIGNTVEAFAGLGLKVMITELDVNVLPTPGGGGADVGTRFAEDPKLNPYREGLPEEVQQRLARRYAGIFEVLLKHRKDITRVTFWGVTDRGSWLNHFPIRGRTNHPLLFDREGRPKAAFQAVVDAGRAGRSNP